MAAVKKTLLAALLAAFAIFTANRFLKLKLTVVQFIFQMKNIAMYEFLFREMVLADREVPVRRLHCHYLNNINSGAEDITILRDGLAFLSTGMKHPAMPSFSDEPGKLFVLDLLHPYPQPVELQIKGGLDLSSFNPHGISVYVNDREDSVYLFVVNHPRRNSQVEIFHVEGEDTLVHLKTITHPLLHSVNDIVAVGPESFYATNDRFYPSDAINLVALVLGLPWCDVIYYSPADVRVVATGLMSANGINISPDKRYIYVSDIADHDIDVFERQDGEHLVFLKSVAVGSLCDNIEVDHRTGDVWLGCYPNAMKIVAYDVEDPPGSEVIRIKNIHSEQPLVSQVYADSGHEIMGSTVAAHYEGKLLIGTAVHKALLCNLR